MINLVNPSSPFLTDQLVMPPLGLMYLMSALKKSGEEVQIIDCATNMAAPDGDLYLTATTPQIDEAIKLAKNREYSVIGGPHASVNPEPLLEHFSAVVVGEGEYILPNIVKEKPHGIIKCPRIKKLDCLCFPDRSIAVNYHYYINKKRTTTMITSRGCNGHCAFCSKAVMNNQIYLRSIDNILAEIDECMSLGFEGIQFCDDTIAINKKRLSELCQKIGKKVIWRCFCRADQVNIDILKLMADSGCHEILYGIESGSQKLLDNVDKGITVAQQERAILDTHRANIRVKASFIVGLPGETMETIEETAQFIRRTRPNDVDINILTVYLGTKIRKHPERYDLTFDKPSWFKGDQNKYQSTVRTSSLSKTDIEEARLYLLSIAHEWR